MVTLCSFDQELLLLLTRPPVSSLMNSTSCRPSTHKHLTPSEAGMTPDLSSPALQSCPDLSSPALQSCPPAETDCSETLLALAYLSSGSQYSQATASPTMKKTHQRSLSEATGGVPLLIFFFFFVIVKNCR